MAMLVTMSNFAGMTYAGDSLMLENAMGWTSMMARMASTPAWRMIVGRLLGLDRIKPKQWRHLPLRTLDQAVVAQPVSFWRRSEEHTSELQSLMRISYAVLCVHIKIQRAKTDTSLQTRN